MKITATLTIGVLFSAFFRVISFRLYVGNCRWRLRFLRVAEFSDPRLRGNPFLFAAMTIVIGTFFALVILFTYLFFLPYYSAWRYLKLPGNRDAHEFELRDTGFYHCTAMREDLTTWQAIEGVSRTRGYIVVKLASWLFHVIPRDAFSDEASYNAFFEEIESRISAVSKS